MKNSKLLLLKYLLILSLSTFLVAFFVQAWQAPTANPPQEDLDEILTTSDQPQSKEGDLNIGPGLKYWITKLGDSFALKNDAGEIKFVLGQDGKVGIGTTSPSGKLGIKQGHGDWITLERTADSGYWHIHNPSSQERIEIGYTSDSGTTQWGMFVIKNDGNLGIGTTSPAKKLHVNGDVQIENNLYMTDGTIYDANNVETNAIYDPEDSLMEIKDTAIIYDTATSDQHDYDVRIGGDAANALYIDTAEGAGLINLVAGAYWNGSDYLYGGSRGASRIKLHDGTFSLYVGGTSGTAGTTVTWKEVMRGLSSGNAYFPNNVGIGTTNPNYKLDVQGQINASGGLCINGDCKSSWGEVGGYWSANGNNIYNTNSGNVGIGTTLPQYKLHVNGSFAATYKNFDIPDPRYNDPHKRLIHSSLEGPEHAVFYRGEAKLKNGKAIIKLPDYFEALTRKEGRTVILTCKNGWSPLYVDGEIENGKFIVRTTKNGDPNQEFYWEVKAIRADVPPLEVEVRR